MIWFLIILFGILSLVLLSGHGSFLISGYNTASDEQKKKYNEKKLCHIMGIGMGLTTIFLILLAIFGDQRPSWFTPVLILLILAYFSVTLLFVNFVRKANTEETDSEPKPLSSEKEEKDKLRQKRILRISLLFTLVIFVAAGIVLTTGHIRVTVENDMLTVEGSYWSDYQIPVSEIQYLTYRENFSCGTRVNGLGSFKLLEGHFENSEYLDYTLYAYRNCNHYIVLKTYQGILVINGETEEKTEELYQTLESCLPLTEAAFFYSNSPSFFVFARYSPGVFPHSLRKILLK